MHAHGVTEGSAQYTLPDGPPTLDKWFQAKTAEVAAALYFELQPLVDLSWTVERANLFDIKLATGMRLDVKASLESGNLIWPYTKNAIFLQLPFDTLVSVSLKSGDYQHCWVEGWISKDEFYARKKTADGVRAPRLDPGTWWMEKNELHNMAELKSQRKISAGPRVDVSALVCVCKQCGAPTERQILIGSFLIYLHPHCENAYMDRLK